MATPLTPYSQLQALIVEDMAIQQTTLRGQLASLGIGRVEGVGSAEDALRLLRSKPFQLVLCDYNLGGRTDGQQLLELLRDEDLLPADCLFFMITAEAGYAAVAAVTEHQPDAYLLKPITATEIGERLKQHLERRQALLAITQCLRKKDHAGAVAACDALLARKDRWYMQALQLKGQALLQLGRPDEAKAVYRDALALRADLGWAQLGLARAHKAASQFQQARELAQQIIDSPGGEKQVAAYDVLADAIEALGDPQGAMWVLKDAARVVPSPRRHRLLGESAYRNGDLDIAKDSLALVAKATRHSAMAQSTDLLLLGQTLVDRGEHGEALSLLADTPVHARHCAVFGPAALAIKAQAFIAKGDTASAAAVLQQARQTLRKPKADLATVALARAELLAGQTEAGLALLEKAVSADHENPRLKQWVGKALVGTGHEERLGQLLAAATEGMEARVKSAKTLLRDNRIDEALDAIEAALHEYPENTGVLLQATQMSCLALRLNKRDDPALVARVQQYLERLNKLMPGSDRVRQMQRYFRETLEQLGSTAARAA